MLIIGFIAEFTEKRIPLSLSGVMQPLVPPLHGSSVGGLGDDLGHQGIAVEGDGDMRIGNYRIYHFIC